MRRDHDARTAVTPTTDLSECVFMMPAGGLVSAKSFTCRSPCAAPFTPHAFPWGFMTPTLWKGELES